MRCKFCGGVLEALTIRCPSCGAQPVLGDRYEIRALIGRGGMGQVFLAYDRRLAAEVAIKRLPPQFASNPEMRDSLEKEARILARLSDSAIVRLFDLADFNAEFYIVLEYVCGPSLRDVLSQGRRPTVREVAHVMGQICQGLTAAHESGVIHRDLKPSNVLLALTGAERQAFAETRAMPASLLHARAKIADFGIAKAIADAGTTFTNAFSGTPGYMAPEQFRGETPSPETDIHALGVITCEMLTGNQRLPESGVIDSVRPAVVDVIGKAMDPVRACRFRSAAEFHEALWNAIEGRSPVRRSIQPAAPPVRNIVRTMAIVGVALGIIFVIGLLSYLVTPKPKQKIVRLPKFEKPVVMELRSPPRATELPPVIEEARAQRLDGGLSGPRAGRVAWEVPLPGFGLSHIVGVAKDGTVYVTGGTDGALLAIREGKILWGYKTGIVATSSVQMEDDGRLWFWSQDSVYCLNRDGKGGRLPETTPAPKRRWTDYTNCIQNHAIAGQGWKLDLDNDCSPAGAVKGRDGRIYVATEGPEILAVSSRGTVDWRFPASCVASNILPTLHNEAVYACKNGSLRAVAGGRQLWKVDGDADSFSTIIADANGTVYYGDRSSTTANSHLHAVDNNGSAVWRIDLEQASTSNMVIDAHRRLYVTASHLNSRLLCVE